MRGDWLAAAARRLAREETFEHAVSPAIADLQHESSVHRGAVLSAYAAVLKTLAGAFVLDLEQDVRLAFGAEAFRRVWTLAALTLGLAVAVRTTIQWLGSGQDLWQVALTLPDHAGSMLPAVLLPATAAFRHARTSRRAVVVAAAAIVVLTGAARVTIVPAAQDARAAYRSAQVPPPQMTPLSELPRELQARVTAGIRGSREAARRTPFALAAAAIGYALLGWSIGGGPAVLIVFAAADLAVTQSFFAARFSASGAAAPWTPAIALLVAAALALWVRRESEGERLTLRSG